uniref:Mitochondrial ribosomal protein S18B n=1 Tax=Hucho hucho TaxID=62062 RepID=A0A4W5NN61_9TELE
MAASIPGVGRILCRVYPLLLQNIRHNKITCQAPASLCTAASPEIPSDAAVVVETFPCIERYGTSPVWSDYRRHHKGGIPPQKTRKTCIVGVTEICGQPQIPRCLQWTIVFLQNVKLLQQFISPYTGVVYDPTRTGKMCQKQKNTKILSIFPGRLPFQVPHLDSSNSHDAVDSAPPPPTMTPWHRWYHTIQPEETEVAQVKKTNKAYLK